MALEEKTESALEKPMDLFVLQEKHFLPPDRAPHGHPPNDKIASYIRYLQENTQELDLLFKELLIGVTSFFRDSAPWEQLRESVIPALLASRPSRPRTPGVGARLLYWEEAYSLAMVFKEQWKRASRRRHLN